jgi:pyruvate kinase
MFDASDETAVGDYPLECVKTMKKITTKTDEYIIKLIFGF